ncbi:MAG TPA: HIT family protein [Terriglobales bacterium]|nr:HIT family protein [Terriglobales bacterium]
MSCLFCQIVLRQVPAHIVFEDALSVAFLDTRPLFHGHCLLVTRAHCETLLDLPNDDVGPFFQTVQRLVAAIERSLSAQGAFVATNVKVSQSVPHLHVHIVPRTKGDGLKGFFWPRKKYRDDDEMAETASRIRRALQP